MSLAHTVTASAELRPNWSRAMTGASCRFKDALPESCLEKAMLESRPWTSVSAADDANLAFVTTSCTKAAFVENLSEVGILFSSASCAF